MSEQLELSITLPVSAQQVYEAWLDSASHSRFTGSEAKIDPQVGGEFTAWDGYIWGKTLQLEPFRCIVQTWRTTEFPDEAPDSQLKVLLEPLPQGARLTLQHTQIPDGKAEQYRQGWQDYYFQPMLEFFKA